MRKLLQRYLVAVTDNRKNPIVITNFGPILITMLKTASQWHSIQLGNVVYHQTNGCKNEQYWWRNVTIPCSWKTSWNVTWLIFVSFLLLRRRTGLVVGRTLPFLLLISRTFRLPRGGVSRSVATGSGPISRPGSVPIKRRVLLFLAAVVGLGMEVETIAFLTTSSFLVALVRTDLSLSSPVIIKLFRQN